uniref:Si:dkey-83h2.3 n=1 Tax=Amphiprion percula TaxID=161767 RepID=A0A3P8U8E2_AMPPE
MKLFISFVTTNSKFTRSFNRCLRCVGVSLVPMAIVCMLSNVLLLFPDLKVRFLLEGHVTREAAWATGVWGSGITVHVNRLIPGSTGSSSMLFPVFQMLCQVLVSCACLLAAASCCLVSATGLSQGPLCLYNSSSGPTWGVPLHSGYLYNRTLWSGVCLEPGSVVQWNVVLFSVMGGTSGLQTLLCGFNVLNSLLGLILGQGFCHNKVRNIWNIWNIWSPLYEPERQHHKLNPSQTTYTLCVRVRVCVCCRSVRCRFEAPSQFQGRPVVMETLQNEIFYLH